jgi:hypothetical protein
MGPRVPRRARRERGDRHTSRLTARGTAPTPRERRASSRRSPAGSHDRERDEQTSSAEFERGREVTCAVSGGRLLDVASSTSRLTRKQKECLSRKFGQRLDGRRSA